MCTLLLSSQVRRRTLPAIPVIAPGTVAVTIIPLDSGSAAVPASFVNIDMGQVAWGARGSQAGVERSFGGSSSTVTAKFGLLLGCPGSRSRQTAEVRVTLSKARDGFEVLLDGRPLPMGAAVIAGFEPCGVTKVHALSMRVARTARPGPFQCQIDFSAATR